MSTVYVQIETVSIPAESALNLHPHPVNGVRGECTRCGRCVVQNPERFRGAGIGPKKSRELAIAAVCEELREQCEHRLPWGVAPPHADRRIPRGLTLFAEEKSTGNRLAVAVDDRGKLVGVWGGVVPSAVVLVVPEGDEYALAAREFVDELRKRGYVGAQVGAREPQGAL